MTAPKKAVQLSIAAFETSLAAGITMAVRWPILWQTLHAPNRDTVAETRLMVDEKIAALIEGTFAAQLATIGFAARLARGDVRHAGDLFKAAADAMQASLKPTRRRVVANAKRLTGL